MIRRIRLGTTLASFVWTAWLVTASGFAADPQPAEVGRLWPGDAPVGDGTREAANTQISVYLPRPERATGAAVVICPGGGYIRHVLNREGPRMAWWLNDHGIAGIVLEYRLPHGRPFVALLDAQRAIRTVRFRAKAWNVDPNRVGIMGFSAGGHLASTAGTHFDTGDPQATDPIDRLSCRPDFMVLVYPVVTLGIKTHGGSKTNLLGPDPKPELVELFSNEKQVTARTPPAFLTHATDDVAVPPENSRQFVAALKAHGVPVEYLELPSGGHGFNGCQGPMWEAWKAKSIEWMQRQGVMSPDASKPSPAGARRAG
jgi:acetyl esterase/lipase